MKQLIFGLVIAIGVVVFAMQNSYLVSIKLFFWELPGISMALILLFTLVAGVLATMLFFISGIFRRNSVIDSQKKRIAELEIQISSLVK
jgi:uncharacterized integral membrane protein